jgi:hypothetical protein
MSSDTVVLGVVIAVSGDMVEVASEGARLVFINGIFRTGDVVYLKKSGQSGGLGTCYAASSPAAPYVKIGTALEAGGSRMTNVMMGMGAVSSGGDTTTGGGAISVFTTSVSGLVPRPRIVSGRYLKDDGTWDNPTSGGKITTGATAPANPQEGDLWIDTSKLS